MVVGQTDITWKVHARPSPRPPWSGSKSVHGAGVGGRVGERNLESSFVTGGVAQRYLVGSIRRSLS